MDISGYEWNGIERYYVGCAEPIWSVLVCLTPARVEIFKPLLTNLIDQIALNPVEIVWHTSIPTVDGGITIGAKRNILIAQARGKYVSFVDSDDMVGQRYIESQLLPLYKNPDCLSLNGICQRKGLVKDKPFIHSLKFKNWADKPDAYLRTPNHWNVMRKEFYLKLKFIDSSWGEDRDHSQRLRESGLLKTQISVTDINYIYQDCGAEGAETAEIARRKRCIK